MPVLTLATAASPSDGSECPRRQPMNAAIIVATTRPTWFGPPGTAIAEKIVRETHQHNRLATAMIASVSVTGRGVSVLFI
jgi:hypothetical protein